MAEKRNPKCARCPTRVCENHGVKMEDGPPSMKKLPGFCPMKNMPEAFTEAAAEYENPQVREFARLASLQEFECFEQPTYEHRARLSRIEELIQFCRKCGYRKLGIAHCGGFMKEAGLLTDILENSGFDVISVQCKAGAFPKEEIGIRASEKISGAEYWESMCNPIAQAVVLNRTGVDLAIILGLCIGHDTLFIKYCDAPVTVLAVKDRLLAHNPLGALYLSESYYRYLHIEKSKKTG